MPTQPASGNRNRLSILILLIAAVAFAKQPTEQQTVRVGIYQNNPKVFQDAQGKPRGIFVDLLQAVAKAEHWTLEFVPGTWQEGLDRLTRSEIDLMPDVSFSPEREKLWTFNREPVLSDWFQIVSRRNRPVNSIIDLAGMRIAVLQNSVQQQTLAATASDADFQLNILPMPDYDTGLAMLRSGQADLMVANRYLSVTISESPDLMASPVIFHPTRLHYAAPLSGHRPMLDAIDRHLTEWKVDPKSIYYQTLKHWTGETPETVIPVYIKYTAAGIAGLILLITAAALLLRWQVQRRTVELRRRTEELETALQQLKETQDKAIQQERLHALGQMASGIAHDFNNILTPVIGLADMLLLYPERISDQEVVKKNLENISQAGRDGAEIVKRMREFYRTYEPEAPRQIDPCDAVDTVIALSRPLWAQVGDDGRRHIDIKTHLTRGLHILAQETELREALLNLIGNALDAIPDSGTVTLTVQQEKQSVVVSVKDTGTGMTPEIEEKCLSAFYTTKGQNGTGIGLAMVKTFCDASHARLDIETREGLGTVISMGFPLQADNIPPHQLEAGTPCRIRPLDILIVDDEQRTLQTLETILQQNHHRITAVSEPGEALKRACAHTYDLVITDRSMPGLSGEELARSIRSLPSAPPVILLTGTPSESAIAKQDKVYVLLKPLDIRRLNRLLADIGFEE
ncbi:MAG: transporter substrate-binding domain-containing protein [Kiritimatiellales bacterium]